MKSLWMVIGTDTKGVNQFYNNICKYKFLQSIVYRHLIAGSRWLLIIRNSDSDEVVKVKLLYAPVPSKD